MSFLRRFLRRPQIECSSCGLKVPVDGPKRPDGFVCEACTDKFSLGLRKFEPTSFYVSQQWSETECACAHCDTPLWNMMMTLKTPWEFKTVFGEPIVMGEGKDIELLECPNPDCEAAWGNLPHHDVITERFQFMTPPWALTKESEMVGPSRYEKSQREANREWWEKRKARTIQ